MKLKNLLFLLAFLPIVALTSCANDDDDKTKMTNYVQLSVNGGTAGVTTIAEDATEPVVVDVLLSYFVEETTTINFALADNEGDVLRLENSVIEIPANTKTAQVKVYSNNRNSLIAEQSVTLTIASSSNDKIVLSNPWVIKVTPVAQVGDLTEEQKALIAGYKESLGIDLYRMLGKLNCSVKVSFPYFEGEDKNYFNDGNDSRTFTGETIITLSENATPEKPVLKMVSNPMGMNDFMFEMLRKNSTEDVWESWYYAPYSMAVMNVVGYTPGDDDKYYVSSTETFEMTLDNIVMESDNAITFVKEEEDEWGDMFGTVPFEYNYSLWNKLQAKSEEVVEVDESGEGDMVEYTLGDLFEYGASLDPKVYLFTTTISEDGIGNEPSDWVEPSASYDFEKGTFKFVFPFAMTNTYGYLNVEVTYSMITR
ncbi:MAG: DUF4929 family protein [Muribaculaceae bacterium]|nr:DUF4929 family protein [Muribaculaceae bacterium]